MRIRSIRPEFWASEDVVAMDWHTRLVFIGLWSYVDDNGVGRDSERLIVAALFPLDEDYAEASRRVTGALATLCEGGQITRYEAQGRRYLHVAAWSKHQRIEKRSEGRYPPPTCDDAQPATPSTPAPGTLPEESALGEGEKGRRGEGEKGVARTRTRSTGDDAFDAFWDAYPVKKDKGAAQAAWGRAVKKEAPELIVERARRFRDDPNRDEQYTKHPKTWLNAEAWNNPPERPRVNTKPTTADRIAGGAALAARLREAEMLALEGPA